MNFRRGEGGTEGEERDYTGGGNGDTAEATDDLDSRGDEWAEHFFSFGVLGYHGWICFFDSREP